MAREDSKSRKSEHGSHTSSHPKHARGSQDGRGDQRGQQHKSTGADDMKSRGAREAQDDPHSTRKHLADHGSADEGKGRSGRPGNR